MGYTADEKVLIWLDSFADLSDRQKCDLFEEAENPRDILRNFEDYQKIVSKKEDSTLYNEMVATLQTTGYIVELLRRLQTEGVTCVTRLSAAYPRALLGLECPPLVLYCKGNISLLSCEGFAVVGSRTIAPDVADRAEGICEDLSKAYVVVTGIAEGGDTCAILGAKKNGRLIAVLPNGMDKYAPESSRLLREEIESSSLVITPFCYGTPALKHCYHRRNEIIAALSVGVLILSAGEKSGALSTVQNAEEMGKRIYAIPYTPGIESGKGCNAVIKRGGVLVESAADILGESAAATIENESLNPLPALSTEEDAVLKVLRAYGRLHFSEIIEKSELSQVKVSTATALLEIKHLIVRCGGNHYATADHKG